MLSTGPSGDGVGVLAPTWSQRAICRVFQRDTPVVSSRFVLPRNTTRLTRWFLQLASCQTQTCSSASIRSPQTQLWLNTPCRSRHLSRSQAAPCQEEGPRFSKMKMPISPNIGCHLC